MGRHSARLDDTLRWFEVAFEHDLAMRERRYRDAVLWLVIALKRLEQDGRPPTLTDIATLAGRRPSTIRRIVRRYNERGPDGFVPTPPAPSANVGRKPALTEPQVQRIRVMLSTGTQKNGQPWTTDAVRREIKRRFHVDVSKTTAWRYLKRARTTGQGGLFSGD
jgi:transposase